MLSETLCDICGVDNWQILGQRIYAQSEVRNCSLYAQKRFRVLFDKWFPGKESITLTSILCRNCGFIIYMPRPQEQDIDSKYKYIEMLGQDYGQNLPFNSSIEIGRSNSIISFLRSHIELRKVYRVLDYGGGDGRLMDAFLNIGKQCFTVDYNGDCIQGVTRLSDTIDHLHTKEKFDLIVCSHVMEHVAQPLKILRLLLEHLNEEGYIFIEVPMDVWKCAPLYYEPVTHVNFFTRNSLYNLLLLGGLIVEECKMAACPHPSGSKRHGIRAIGRKSATSSSTRHRNLRSPDGMELIRPNILSVIRYHLCVPDRLPRIMLRKMKHSMKLLWSWFS